jgi:aspartokinase-like uncharacterized kinase
MPMNKSIIVKVGGKILENRDNIESTLNQFKSLLSDEMLQKVIIIPGGGSLADFVRIIDDKLNIGDDLAHWMAIYAMNHNGVKLCNDFKEIICIDNYRKLQTLLKSESEKGIYAFLPYEFLSQEDQLPHDWEVTSDSITLYLAHRLELKECYLIKDVDGIMIHEKGQEKVIQEMTTSDYITFKNSKRLESTTFVTSKFKKSQPVDSYLLCLIDKTNVSCVILNGIASKTGILEYFGTKKTQNRTYTKIY